MAAIVLYDGSCRACDAAVRFVLPRDPTGYFRFARQEGALGQRLLGDLGLAAEGGRTMVLVEDGRAYLRSDAVLRIARRLRGAARLLAVAGALPRGWRDALYDVVARHRRTIFGETACHVIPPEMRDRFLDDDTPAPLDPRR